MNGPLWLAVIGAASLLAYLLYRTRPRKPRQECLPANTALRFTTHARERMELRRVSTDQVMHVLANPDRFTRDTVKNSVRLERDEHGRTLKVWIAEPWPTRGEVLVRTTAWHYWTHLAIPDHKVGRVIGRGGATIRQLRTETGARIDVSSDGTISISANDGATVEHARQRVCAVLGQAPESDLARRGPVEARR